MVSDISARKQAEERQAQLTAQLDTVLSNVIQGVAMFDSAQQLAVWNEPRERRR